MTNDGTSKERTALKQCACSDNSNAVCRVNGCFLGTLPPDAEKIKPYIGHCICFHCGGEVNPPPKNWDSVSGGTVLDRLKELGMIV